MSHIQQSDRSYRRGAIMGLTMAEAFILIAFALLLLFAFWQWEVDKENTPELEAFKELAYQHRQTVLISAEDGSLDAFMSLKESGVDFSTPEDFTRPKEHWRFIDKDDLRRLIDALDNLPEGLQHDLADMVEADKAKTILNEMGKLEELVEAGKSLEDLMDKNHIVEQIEESGMGLEELLETARLIEILESSGTTLDEIIAAAAKIDDLKKVGQTIDGISQKIRNADRQERALVSALHSELGDIVASVGGHIDPEGSIILPDQVLFAQGQASVTPSLAKFLASACQPWLATLQGSGVDISEIKIEGHASSEWRTGTSPRAAYLGNLDLSQRRSQAVLRSCLDFVPDKELLAWAQQHLIAVGYSSVRPILAEGQEDKTASRRVVFSVTPNRQLLLDEIETDAKIGRYDRDLFGGWADTNGDCRNARQDVLQQLSLGDVTWSTNNCTISAGHWDDPYTGKKLTRARDVEIDHLVPLKWAWDHGAHLWSEEKRYAFANDPENLFAVSYSVNREKGAGGPLDWLPENKSFRCQYIRQFVAVTKTHDLLLSSHEEKQLALSEGEACQ